MRPATARVVSVTCFGEVRPVEQAYGARTTRKIEIRQRVDGSATIRVYRFGGDDQFLAEVDLPAPAGDDLLAAFGA